MVQEVGWVIPHDSWKILYFVKSRKWWRHLSRSDWLVSSWLSLITGSDDTLKSIRWLTKLFLAMKRHRGATVSKYFVLTECKSYSINSTCRSSCSWVIDAASTWTLEAASATSQPQQAPADRCADWVAAIPATLYWLCWGDEHVLINFTCRQAVMCCPSVRPSVCDAVLCGYVAFLRLNSRSKSTFYLWIYVSTYLCCKFFSLQDVFFLINLRNESSSCWRFLHDDSSLYI